MLQDQRDGKLLDSRERELIVAYLRYALEDVRALSEIGSHFLQMTIASLTDEAALDSPSEPPLQTTQTH
jgi:hypothetical protein